MGFGGSAAHLAALVLGLHLNPNGDQFGRGRVKGLKGHGKIFEKISNARKERLQHLNPLHT
jgi:hypothetical protein